MCSIQDYYCLVHTLTLLFGSLFISLAIEMNCVIYLGVTDIDLMPTFGNISNESLHLCGLLKESNAVKLIDEPTRVTYLDRPHYSG